MIGMGPLEVLVVLLIAFIVVGPERMVDAARLLGKASRELRRMTASVSALSLDEELPDLAQESVVRRGGGPERGDSDSDDVEGEEQDEGPVAFTPSVDSDSEDDAPAIAQERDS
jgi:Sec-independent protein translocase protein TatA